MHVKIVVLVVNSFPFLTFLPSSSSKKDTAGFVHLVIHLMIFLKGHLISFSFMSPVPNRSWRSVLSGIRLKHSRSPAREYLKPALRVLKTDFETNKNNRLFCSPVYRLEKKLKEMAGSENGLEPGNNIDAF